MAIARRALRPADLPDFLKLAQLLHEEAKALHTPYDEPTATAYFEKVVADQQRYFSRAVTLNDVIVGVVIAEIVPFPTAKATQVVDQFHYVIPEARGLPGFALWQCLLKWAEKSGAVELIHGACTCSLSGHRFFRGVGMTRVGTIYRLRLFRG